MEKLKQLKEQIEMERKILDKLVLKDDRQAVYRQSLVVDILMEEYMKVGEQLPA